MKILNLYAGIGGNRKLWGDKCEVIAVENDPAIAAIYKDFFPDDEVIVADAHIYLLAAMENSSDFDFIWSSPPCPTHSRMNTLLVGRKIIQPRYPDMKLYEEILLLKHWFKGKYTVENVRSYYDPLIPPLDIQNHYFWANFSIPPTGESRKKVRNDKGHTLAFKMKQQGIEIADWHGYKGDKRTLINNMVEPELGLHILNASQKIIKQGALL